MEGKNAPLLFRENAEGSQNLIEQHWKHVANDLPDPDHTETAANNVIRMEYYYILKSQNHDGHFYESILSDIPWDTRIEGHDNMDGLRDVEAIGVVLAIMEPGGQSRLAASVLWELIDTLEDFDPKKHAEPGALEAAWRETIKEIAAQNQGFPRVRIFWRWIALQ